MRGFEASDATGTATARSGPALPGGPGPALIFQNHLQKTGMVTVGAVFYFAMEHRTELY